MAELLFDYVRRRGHLVSTTDVVQAGFSRKRITTLVAQDVLVRPCRGWIATTDATQDAVLAVVNNGKLASVSALKDRGLWDGCSPHIHVQVPPNTPRKSRRIVTPIARFQVPQNPRFGIRRHWLSETAPDPREFTWRVSVVDALIGASSHLPDDQFIACLDSALHSGALLVSQLPTLREALPHRTRTLLSAADAASESGLESLARVRLSRIAQRIDIQVGLPDIGLGGGPGRLDLLLNGWLNIELDGDRWHDSRDHYARDAAVVRHGLRTQRFNYAQVINEWQQVAGVVSELLANPPLRSRT